MGEEEKVTVYRLRYLFEHRLLPGWIYGSTGDFLGKLLQDGDYLYKRFDLLCRQYKVENPYSAGQFIVENSVEDEEITVLKMTFPVPEKMPLCYRVYLFSDRTLENVSYYCIEKTGIEGENDAVLCEWNRDGAHINYGKLNVEKEEDFDRCFSLYKGKAAPE